MHFDFNNSIFFYQSWCFLPRLYMSQLSNWRVILSVNLRQYFVTFQTPGFHTDDLGETLPMFKHIYSWAPCWISLIFNCIQRNIKSLAWLGLNMSETFQIIPSAIFPFDINSSCLTDTFGNHCEYTTAFSLHRSDLSHCIVLVTSRVFRILNEKYFIYLLITIFCSLDINSLFVFSPYPAGS